MSENEHKLYCEIAQRHGLDCYPSPHTRYIVDVDEDKTNYGKKSEEIWLMDKLWEIIVKLDKENGITKTTKTK